MNQPLSLRMPADELDLIDRAAHADNRSRTEFMRAASVRVAHEILLSRRVIELSSDAFERFEAAMNGPAEISPEMLSVFRRKAPWEMS